MSSGIITIFITFFMFGFVALGQEHGEDYAHQESEITRPEAPEKKAPDELRALAEMISRNIQSVNSPDAHYMTGEVPKNEELTVERPSPNLK